MIESAKASNVPTLTAPKTAGDSAFWGVTIVVSYWALLFVARALLLEQVNARFPSHADSSIAAVTAWITVALTSIGDVGVFAVLWIAFTFATVKSPIEHRPVDLLRPLGLAHIPLLVYAILAVAICASPPPVVDAPVSPQEYLHTGRFITMRILRWVAFALTLVAAIEWTHKSLRTRRRALGIIAGCVAACLLALEFLF